MFLVRLCGVSKPVWGKQVQQALANLGQRIDDPPAAWGG